MLRDKKERFKKILFILLIVWSVVSTLLLIQSKWKFNDLLDCYYLMGNNYNELYSEYQKITFSHEQFTNDVFEICERNKLRKIKEERR